MWSDSQKPSAFGWGFFMLGELGQAAPEKSGHNPQ
jgi:hypothetical protein